MYVHAVAPFAPRVGVSGHFFSLPVLLVCLWRIRVLGHINKEKSIIKACFSSQTRYNRWNSLYRKPNLTSVAARAAGKERRLSVH